MCECCKCCRRLQSVPEGTGAGNAANAENAPLVGGGGAGGLGGLRRSVRTYGLADLENADMTTTTYTDGDVAREVSFAWMRQELAKGTYEARYNVRERILEEVGGHSKEGTDRIRANANLRSIYEEVCADLGMEGWIAF